MKLMLLGVCILLWVSQLTLAEFPPMIITACVREHKVKALDLALSYGTEMAEASQPVKCYLTCLFESIGIIVDGEVNPKIIDMALSNNQSSQQMTALFNIIKSCKDIKSEVKCASGYLLMRCFMDYGKDALFQPEPNTEL